MLDPARLQRMLDVSLPRSVRDEASAKLPKPLLRSYVNIERRHSRYYNFGYAQLLERGRSKAKKKKHAILSSLEPFFNVKVRSGHATVNIPH